MREGKLPLRTILQNFINHVDTLETKRGEDDQYDREFQELKLLTETLKSRVDYTCQEGEKDVNRRKNRYKDILPYDYTRVVLSGILGVPGCDYINANYIRGASGSRAYIASQGPLPHTTPDFWRCVVECEVQVIIMASNETEGGKHKCECYWVNKVGEERQYGNITVSFVKGRQVCPDFMVRTLKIKYPNDQGKTEERTICQFHYVLWPDHGVPETVRPLLDMVRLVRDCQASETLPVLVHCSAGCGRTGTICAIDYVWGLLRAGRLTENLDLFGLVKEMRRQRVAMVQTKEQYILLHRAVKELFKERLKVIDAHPYENVATDGTPLILREKESDYEELFVKPEKQDQSAKVYPPTTTPSNVSTPTGSLTRYIHSNRINKDESGKTPSPASTPSAVSTPTGSLTRYPSIPHTHKYDTEPLIGSWPGVSSSNLLDRGPPSLLPPGPPLPTKASKAPVPHLTFTSPQHHTYDSTMSSASSSKVEKNKENAAHKRQVVYQPAITPPLAVSSPLTSPNAPPVAVSSPNPSPQAAPLSVSSPLNSPYTGSQRMIQLSDSPQPLNASISGPNTPFATPNSTPANTPNTTPNPLQALNNATTPNSSTPSLLQGVGSGLAPAPPTRSRTPSPVVAFRRSMENALDSPGDVESNSPLLYHSMEDVQNKSGELVRRPSIAKLKEMFEKSVDLDNPGTRLSRSASSVTSRSPTLTLHQDNSSSSRVKRKNSLGAEETLQTKKAYEIIEKSKQLNICPPPPSSSEQQSFRGLQHSKSSSCVGKPPSSPVWASPAFRRRPGGGQGQNESHEEANVVLLARVDDRPALPVKKSKSFRSTRPIYSPSNTIASTRSPELSRKKERKDINTYFSLDRGKNEVIPAMSRSESGNIQFIGDIPSPREGFKLSVYQSLPVEGTDAVDSKPQIPPKKSIGDRFKGSRPPEYLCISSSQVVSASQQSTQQNSDTSSSVSITPSTPPTPQSAPPTINSIYDAPSLWNHSHHTGKDSKDKSSPLSSPTIESNSFTSNITSQLTTTTTTTSPNLSPASDVVDFPAGKDYVNARIIRNSNTADTMESPKYVYVPLPTKRTTRDQKPHEYANYNIGGNFPRKDEESSETFLEAQDIKKNIPGKFPVYDDVSPSSSINSSQSLRTSSRENINASQPATSPNTPQTPSTPQNADYEMMDFGESSSNVDEVFETVNYELLGSKEKGKMQDDDNMSDFLLKRDLDPIARQVYQDCQDYLLHGNNQSPVPSLMPKIQQKDAPKQNSSSRKQGSILDTSMDVDEVKNKVAVAPQGLRTRERRNSYRQAVNPPSSGNTPTSPTTPSTPGSDQLGSSDVRKSVHKYETIWFENGKQQQQGTKRNNQSPPSQPNLKSSNTHKESDDIPRSSSSSYVQRPSPPSSVDEQSPNLNSKTTNKEAMFKEKLDELHSLVKSLERQKASTKQNEGAGQTSSAVGDESGSVSHGSSSASSALQSPSSTLQSRSSTSSKSELHEPIYANTNTLNAPTPPKSNQGGPSQKFNSSEPKSPQNNRQNESGRPSRNSPTINGSSIYGTIATSTFRHKNNNSSPNPHYQGQNSTSSQGKPPSPYHSMPPTATLPARPNVSPTPYHNIPPPKGFGGTVSAGNSPNPLQEISNRENNNKDSSSSAYYRLGMFGSVRGNMRGGGSSGQQSDQCGSSGSPAESPTSKPISPYSNIPPNAAGMSRSTGNYPQHTPKAHIVGDIAIVGESSVRLRGRSGTGPSSSPQRPVEGSTATTVGDTVAAAASATTSDSNPAAPVAPPRIKRNSSAAAVPSSRGGGGHQQPQQQHSQSHWRSGDESEGFSTRTAGSQSVKQGWNCRQEEGPPPMIPAKTAAAYQFPLDHTSSAHTSPSHPPTSQHPPYIQPPPPKPVLQATLSSSSSNHHHHHGHKQHNHQQHHHHQHQAHHHRKVHSSHVAQNISQTIAASSSTQPLSSGIYQSPIHQSAAAAAPAQSSPSSSSQSSNVDRESQPNIHQVDHYQSANNQTATDSSKTSTDLPKSATNEISEESSDEEGIFHKFSAPNLFKKWITTPNSNSKSSKSGNGAPSSPKSVFYPTVHQTEKELRDEAIETRGNAGSGSSAATKENSHDFCTPTSPKPLVKALGKLKTSSKSVAANFKSYLTPRGDKIENSENVRGTAAGSSHSDHLGGLQKSMSTGQSNSSYSQVQKDFSYPSPLPKKPCGPQDLNMHKTTHPSVVLGSVDTQVKQPRPRQQYL